MALKSESITLHVDTPVSCFAQEHRRPFSVLPLLFVLTVLIQTCVTEAYNPVKEPIIQSNILIHTRKFARIPDYFSPEKNETVSPNIQATVHLGRNLYVVTSTTGGRIYKVSRRGEVSLWFDVKRTMDRRGRTLDEREEMHAGLRSLAFHPRFGSNRLLYIAVLEKHEGDMSSKRYLWKPSDDDVIDADSVVLEFRADTKTREPLPWTLREVLRVGLPVYDHPIKQMAFQKQLLYIAHGDGSVQSAVVGGGQNFDPLGKILRINPLRLGSEPYRIPRSNPFVRNGKYPPEVYAVGLRNPHNICFSKKEGDLFVADAGRDNVEEVNIVKRGGNYGWSQREGNFIHREVGGIGTGVGNLKWNDSKYGFEYPVAVLGHEGRWGDGWIGFAIAGGCPIENGSELDGLYLYCNFAVEGQLYFSRLGQMRNAITMGKPDDLNSSTTFQVKIAYDHDRRADTPPVVLNELRDVVNFRRAEQAFRSDVRFGQGSLGEIYWMSKSDGWVYLITNSVP